MMPGWDKSQDLRGSGEVAPAPQSQQPAPQTDITQAVADAADRITAARVVTQMVREGRKMSLLGKLQHLTEEANAFNAETEQVLDGIAAKIAIGRKKRDEAKDKHHTYYDGIIDAIDQSTVVIDRLSNGPLSGDGK